VAFSLPPDPRRFRKGRDVGGYLGLQPGRRKSGQSEPQLHISKEGDPYSSLSQLKPIKSALVAL
jgi:transposase